MTQAAQALEFLNDEQQARFRRDGFVVIPDFLSADEIRRVLDELENLTGRLEGPLPPNASVAWEKQPSDGRRIAHQVMNPHLLSTGVRDVVYSERVKRLGHDVLCDDLTLAHSKFILKEKKKGTEIPWHQDMPYWIGEYSAGFITIMLYLSDADRGNGCLEVVPGSHAAGLRRSESSRETTFELRTSSDVSVAGSVNIEAAAGAAIVFGPFLLHRSGPNLSDRHRRSISIVLSSSWNLHIERLDDAKPPLVKDVAERRKIRRLTGPGPHNGAWPAYYRRRALREVAKECVVASDRPWVEITDAFCEEDSFAWFASRKPPRTPLMRVQKYPLVKSTRADAEIFTGDVGEQLAALQAKVGSGTRAGLIAFDLATNKALNDALVASKPLLDAGTILLIDRFFAPIRKRGSRGGTLERFAKQHGIRLEYLARADFSVVVKVEAVGTQGSVEFSTFEWHPKAVGIAFEQEKLSQFALEELKTSRLAAGARRLLGPAWRGVRTSVQEVRGRVKRA